MLSVPHHPLTYSVSPIHPLRPMSIKRTHSNSPRASITFDPSESEKSVQSRAAQLGIRNESCSLTSGILPSKAIIRRPRHPRIWSVPWLRRISSSWRRGSGSLDRRTNALGLPLICIYKPLADMAHPYLFPVDRQERQWDKATVCGGGESIFVSLPW
jgi:hypothetical protein